MRTQDKEKVTRILDGTGHIIMTEGLAAASLSRIAREAKIASGTLYTYFKNKDDMLRALYLNRKVRVAEAITQFDVHGDPYQEFDHFMDLIYAYGQERLEDFLLIREFNQTPMLKQLNVTKEEAYSGFEKLQKFVQVGVEKGAFLDLNYQVLLDYAYTPVIEYLVAIQNQTLDPKEVPFEQIKMLSKRAVLNEK